MSPTVAVPLIVAIGILAIDWWVYADASVRAGRGDPVTFRAGPFVLDTPGAWFLACLLFWVIFFPLYLSSRA